MAPEAGADTLGTMADVVSLVTATIQLINTCVNTYTNFCAFKEECEAFRTSLVSVVGVLRDVEQELSKSSTGSGSAGPGDAITKLEEPMQLLNDAVEEGEKVLEKCSAKRTLKVLVFSRQYMGMLNKARYNIELAMRLVKASSITIQVSTRRMMDSLAEQLAELNTKISAIRADQNEALSLILRAIQLLNDNGQDGASTSISDTLIEMGVVSSTEDYAEQFADLQSQAETTGPEAEFCDKAILKALSVLAPRDDDGFGPAAAPGTRSEQQNPDTKTSSVVLECPISGKVMHDPVIVVESLETYDREFLCRFLRMHPDLNPASGKGLDLPLRYIPNLAVRRMIMSQYGDAHYQKYDDKQFKAQYAAYWKERLILSAGATELAKRGAATVLKEKIREYWSSRRGRMLIVGAGIVAVLVVVGVVLGVLKPWPGGDDNVPTPSSSPTAVEEPTPSPTIFEKFNASLPLRTMESLQDSASPQYRAYNWTMQSDQVPGWDEPNDEETTLFRMKQRFALATLFYSIHGLESRVNSSVSECQWDDAATCNSGSQLVSLVFDRSNGGNGGILPPEVGLLTNLVSVVLNSLGLTSSIPTELELLVSLTQLNLFNNAITSSIPTELGRLSALTGLRLYKNDLTSSIPTELGKLTVLTSLDLSNNSLTSSIPTELGMASSLLSLDLHDNALTSAIPTELGRLSALMYLQLYENALNASIPTQLGQLSDLKFLSLFSNALTASIPTELGNLSALTHLSLNNNQLTGSFPFALCHLGDIEIDCSKVFCTCCGC